MSFVSNYTRSQTLERWTVIDLNDLNVESKNEQWIIHLDRAMNEKLWKVLNCKRKISDKILSTIQRKDHVYRNPSRPITFSYRQSEIWNFYWLDGWKLVSDLRLSSEWRNWRKCRRKNAIISFQTIFHSFRMSLNVIQLPTKMR